jgi:hypothetical protein
MNRLVHARQLSRRAALGVLLAIAGAGSAIAQADFPSRPLRIIVPQPPGGGFDFVGRTLADALGRQLAQSVVVDNRTGSGTLVGTDAAAKSTPDGYTLLVGSVSNLVLNPALYATLPYDSVRDFEPLGVAVTYSYTLMARKDLAVTSLADLVQQARAKPGGFSYASAGNGSGQHVLAAALWHLAGVELVHVPYRGAQAAYQDLLGGRVDLFFDLALAQRAGTRCGLARGAGRLRARRRSAVAAHRRADARAAGARPRSLDPAAARQRHQGGLNDQPRSGRASAASNGRAQPCASRRRSTARTRPSARRRTCAWPRRCTGRRH